MTFKTLAAPLPKSSPTDPLMRANHLTVVRWLLAGLVALGHLWLLTRGHEPFRIHQWTGSYMAVNGFFILSGLLIAKSLHTRNSLSAYTKSRLLRIYPALTAIVLAFIFIFSPVFSEPGGISRLWSVDSWTYGLRVLAMGNPEQAPGGIFAANLEKDFNGPLWTIRYEMAAYILAAIAFACGLISRLSRVLILFVSVQCAYLFAPLFLDFSALPDGALSLLRLSSAFLLGMVLWQWPAARRPHWGIVIALLGAFLIFGEQFGGELVGNLALTGLILRFGLSNRTLAPLVKLPDYSYGIYIWHYPILQAVLFFSPGLGPIELGLIGVPLFILVSALSWHLIEKPALKLKHRPGPKAVLVYESQSQL